MVEPINLNKYRKAKARAEKQQRAEENRIKHGRRKADKAHDKLEQARARRNVEQSKREDEE